MTEKTQQPLHFQGQKQHSLEEKGEGKTLILTQNELQELQQLRKENRILKMEREILKRATAFFAKEKP